MPEMGTGTLKDIMNDKFIIFYIWFLSIMATVFLSNELFMMKHHNELVHANRLVTNCNKVLAGVK